MLAALPLTYFILFSTRHFGLYSNDTFIALEKDTSFRRLDQVLHRLATEEHCPVARHSDYNPAGYEQDVFCKMRGLGRSRCDRYYIRLRKYHERSWPVSASLILNYFLFILMIS